MPMILGANIMQRHGVLMMILMLGGCTQLDDFMDKRAGVALCQARLEQALKAPETLKVARTAFKRTGLITREERLSAFQIHFLDLGDRFEQLSISEKLTLADMKKTLNNPKELNRLIDAQMAEGPAEGSMAVIEYDANNPMGVPMRGTYFCKFEAPVGKAPTKVSSSGEVPREQAEAAFQD